MWRKYVIVSLLALISVSFMDFGEASEKSRQSKKHSQKDRDRRDRIEEIEIVKAIRLRNDVDNRQVMIESVILITDNRIFGTRTERGVERSSANKVSLKNLPFIGDLFSSKVPTNLRPEQEVGRAYSNGSTFVITISPKVDGSDVSLEFLPKDVDILNESLRALMDSNQPPAGEV
jgi:hypothetical protein